MPAKKDPDNIKTPTGRGKLKPRGPAYFEPVSPRGLAIGYRKRKSSSQAGDNWTARLYLDGTYYYMESLPTHELPSGTTDKEAFDVVTEIARTWRKRFMRQQILAASKNAAEVATQPVSRAGIPTMLDVLIAHRDDNLTNAKGEVRTQATRDAEWQRARKHFITGKDWFARTLVTELTREQMTKVLQGILDGCTGDKLQSRKSTWNRTKNVLVAALNFVHLNQNDYLPKGIKLDNLAWIRLGKFEEMARPYILSPVQRQFVLKAADDEDAYNLILAGLYTGARVTELKDMCVRDLDHQTQTMRFTKHKTRERHTGLSDEAYIWFCSLTDDKNPDDPILTFRGQKWPDTKYYYRMTVQVFEQANKLIKEHNKGLPARERVQFVHTKAPMYTQRHTHSSQALLDGMRPDMVAKNVGNHPSVLFRNYTKFLSKDVVERMNEVSLIKDRPQFVGSGEDKARPNLINKPTDKRIAELHDLIAHQYAVGELPAIFNQTSPLHDQWRDMRETTMVKLVWSAPMLILGELFGVSDNAVRKRCRKQGIPMPWPGYWREVETGKRKYPNGIPDIK